MRHWLGWTTRRYPRHWNWVLADQAIISGTNFLTGILVARALGIEAFGVFSLAWLAVLFAFTLQSAAVLSPMMSVGPKQAPSEEARYYAAVAVHQLAFSALFALVVLLTCSLARFAGLGSLDGEFTVALAVCGVLVQLHEFLRRYNFTLQRTRAVLISDLTRNGLQLFALGGLLLYGADADVSGVLLVMAASALVGILALAGGLPSPRWEPLHVDAVRRRHARFARWLVGSSLMQWTTGNFFIVAAGVMLGPLAVGALRAAQNLIAVTHVFFMAADNVVPAKAARIYAAGGKAALQSFVRRLTLVGLAGTAAVCLVFAVPSEFWLTTLFGPSFAGYGFVVWGFAAYYLLVACTIPLQYAFLAMETTRPIFAGYLLATVFTLVLSYPLLQALGTFGVIVGLAAAQLIILASMALAFGRREPTGEPAQRLGAIDEAPR